ncbi:MAG: RnfH family protein [Woeseiaceae bacterium]|nr:RnfH family protein [Woeseiaceae bacterium]
MAETIEVEVVYATPDRQRLLDVRVPVGATVAEVIETSGIAGHFRDDNLEICDVGIWGRIVDRQTVVADGDRIELYRPLAIDPREARRQRAKGPD